MIDSSNAGLALWARALTAVIATTGITNLSATSTGYARDSGSFLDEGFWAGMELTPSGFPQTAVGVVTEVQALALTIDGGRTPAVDAGGRSLIVGVPSAQCFKNLKFTRPDRRPWIRSAFVPGGASRLQGLPAAGARVEETGLYLLDYVGLANYGEDGIRKAADAIKALYPPTLELAIGGSSYLRVRADFGPWAGEVIPDENGFARCTITIPWRARSFNSIAA